MWYAQKRVMCSIHSEDGPMDRTPCIYTFYGDVPIDTLLMYGLTAFKSVSRLCIMQYYCVAHDLCVRQCGAIMPVWVECD